MYFCTFTVTCGETTRNLLIARDPDAIRDMIAKLYADITKIHGNCEISVVNDNNIQLVRYNEFVSTLEFRRIMITKDYRFYVDESDAEHSDQTSYVTGQLVPNEPHCYLEDKNDTYVDKVPTSSEVSLSFDCFTLVERVALLKALETLTENQRQKISALTGASTGASTGVLTGVLTGALTGEMRPCSPDKCRCLARIHDQSQCTRKYKDHTTQLCGSHANSLPYGKVGDPTGVLDHLKIDHHPEKKCVTHKKRNNSTNNAVGVDLSKYIETTPVDINGNHYLIDTNGVIFINSESCVIMGRKLAHDQYEWF